MKILLVDDEPENCFVVSKALQEEGHQAVSTFSGEEALEQLGRERPDLVMLDIRMPGMDGVEVLTKIREKDKDILVIIVSAFENVSTAVRCMRLGAYDYLTKPINVHELKITVANALRTLHLQSEVERLKGEIEKNRGLERMIGDSPAIRQTASLIRRIAEHDITILVTGESGTGKEVVAEAIHVLSGRRDRPFVSVDCAALPEHLVESELFGFEKGAFTGAVDRKLGRFELANGGVLFLDEIGNLPVSVQIKLLRVLQERQLSRLGSKSSVPIDVRIIAATNVDLKAAIKRGEFREDLYYRLNEFNIHLPPLRERGDDVAVLANYFLHRFNGQFGRQVQGFHPEVMQVFRRHPWTGNVRELQNAVKRAVIMAEEQVRLADLPQEMLTAQPAPRPSPEEERELVPAGALEPAWDGQAGAEGVRSLKEATQSALRQVEQEMINRALKASRWNKAKTAKMLQIDYKTLYNKLKEYHIE